MTAHPFEPGEQSDDEWAICPYCGAKSGDCWEWVTGHEQEEQCYGCGKVYLVSADYDVAYNTRAKP